MDAVTSGMLVPSTYRFCILPSKVFFAPAQRCSWPTLPCSCRTQRAFLRSRPFSSSPTASPHDRLVLADVGERAELLGLRGAGVHGDDRDARLHGLGDHGLHRVRLGQRDDQPVDLLVDRGLDELGLLVGLVVVRVEEVDVVLHGRLLGALLDDVPEGVAVARVGDHGEGPARCVHRGPSLGRGGRALLGALAAGAAASREGGAQHHCQHGAHRAYPCPNPCHDAVPFYCCSLCCLTGPGSVRSRPGCPSIPEPRPLPPGRAGGGASFGAASSSRAACPRQPFVRTC